MTQWPLTPPTEAELRLAAETVGLFWADVEAGAPDRAVVERIVAEALARYVQVIHRAMMSELTLERAMEVTTLLFAVSQTTRAKCRAAVVEALAPYARPRMSIAAAAAIDRVSPPSPEECQQACPDLMPKEKQP